MAVVKFAEFLPDRPDLSEGTRFASGVIALTPDSYGPVRALQSYTTSALNSQCLGLASMEDVTSSIQTFAGSATDLFLLPEGSTTFSNVSSTPGAYHATAADSWHIVQFNEIVVATDFADPIQAYTMGISTKFATLATAAPHARYAAVTKQFLIVGNTSDPVGGINPQRLWWCANGDPTNWPTPGSTQAQQTQSDFNDCDGPQGGITGLVPSLAGCDCAIFFERAVWQMFYVGPPDIFNLYPCAAVKGCPAPNSLVTVGEMVYGLFEDGFYSFDGSTATPIGNNKVDRWFFDTVNLTSFNSVIGAPDVANKAIFWLFQSNAALNGQPDTILIYRWDIQRFSWASVPAQWIARVPVPVQNGGIPPFVGPLIGGQLQLAAIDQGQRLAYFNGLPLPAVIGTQVAQITPGFRSFVQGVRPLVDATIFGAILNEDGQPLLNEDGSVILAEGAAPPVASGTALLNEDGDPLLNEDGSPLLAEANQAAIALTTAISARNTYQQPEVIGPPVNINSMGECPYRSDGRYHRVVANVSGILWNTAYGVDVRAIKAGFR
jgi:hypothetical protein